MRKVKETKNNNHNNLITQKADSHNNSSQTPIEIALKIDENGMTTLKNLYEFLGLNISHYSSWCKRNIINNPFATEGIDYIPFRHESENHTGGRPTYDYKLSSDFAKQLSMTVKNERGQEARQYFIACEQGLKIATQKLKSIPPNNDTNEKLIEFLTSMDNRLSKLEDQSNKAKLPVNKYSRWKSNTFKKLKTLLSYVNENSEENLTLPNIMHLVIGETEDLYDIEINEYADLYRCEFCIDPDIKVQVLDVISHYKDIRDMFTLTLDSIMKKLHIPGDTCGNKSRNIFDELAAKIENNLEK